MRACQRTAAHFNPLPRKEGDTVPNVTAEELDDFNPLPRKEGDALEKLDDKTSTDFNPLPRKEGDLLHCQSVNKFFVFQSTPS